MAARLLFFIDVDLSKMDTTHRRPGTRARRPLHPLHALPDQSLQRENPGDATFTNCRIRYKGNTTFNEKKRQFKIAFGKNERLEGMPPPQPPCRVEGRHPVPGEAGL
jgi:hypothetical protein